MSEDSESEIESQQKRKISKLKDSSNNEDDEDDNDDDDDDSDFDVISKKKRKLIKLEDSPAYSSSSSDIIASSSSISARRFRMKPVIEDSDSDNSTDSSSSFEFRHKTNRLPRIKSDIESDSSNSVVIRRNRRRPPPRVFSDDDDDNNNTDASSQWNSDVSDEEISNKSTDRILLDFDSDSSNGQTEKCPICLISLNKNQEIGIPEICEHMFCAECIQEWSKSMNTCPVDRQPYNLIFVRKNLHGVVYREIEIEPPNQQQLQQPEEEVDIDVVYEDATFCEICGRCDREERMLLCDGCDLGYHLECLTPPLDEIPGGTWYCSSCEIDEDYQPIQNNRTRINRLIPRTRHSERVRHRIRNNRTLAEFATTSTISSNENNRTPPIVTSTTRNYRYNQRKRSTTKKKRRKRQRYRYKTTYQIDEKTGETVLIKKRIKKRRRKSKKARQNRNNVQKTVKGRLASQLGICAPRTIAQILPEMRVQRTNDSNIIASRQQAGVPTLHLFGQRNELDYFPQSDNESDNEILSNTGGGPNVLIRRPPNRNDILAFRRRNRLKNISIPDQVSTTTNVLDNILDMQTKFYSKETIFNIDKSGKFTMNNKNDNNNNDVNLNDYNQAVRQRTASCSNNNSNNDSVPSSSRHDDNYQNNTNNSTPTSTVDTSITNSNNTASNNNDNNQAQDSSSSSLQRNLGHFNTAVDERRKDRKTKNSDISENSTRSNTPYSGDSEIDIYSDIETVSTSKVDDNDIKQQSPIQLQQQDHTNDDDDDDNDSESDMIIDTDKTNHESEDNAKEETAVTSTVDNNSDRISMNTVTSLAHSTTEIQSEAVQSSNQRDSYMEKEDDDDNEQDDDDSEDGCPNFSIYSKESQNLAKNIDISIPTDNNQTEQTNQVGEISSSPAVETVILSNVSVPVENTTKIETTKPINSGLYSDSEDETIVKKNINSFALNDIRNMTEDISEEERSYTPCLDEREPVQQGIEGLDTEMISDEDRNDFDESHDIKTETDGEALEINAKESELDFTRPEDCEEGEIVDKTKIKKTEDSKNVNDVKKESKQEIDNSDDKENDSQSKEPVFKKLSKNNKERNYRDKDKEKDRSRSRSKDRKSKNDKDIKKEKKKEKRKEMERYNVRAVVAERPKRCLKDRFGRDLRCSISRSKSRSISLEKSPSRNRRSSSKTRRSLTPPPPSISSSRNRRSPSREYTITTTRKKQSQQQQQQRGRSRTRRSRSHSSTERKRSRSKTKKRKRSSSYERSRRRKSRDRSKTKKTKRSRSRHRTSRSITPKRRKDWTRRHSREWSPSLSRSRSPEPRHLTPSWTPPRLMDNTVKPHKLTVILTNDSNKKKKDKKRKAEKKTKENDKQKKKKRSDRTPPPSKEVFASGDNILVSVSFNKENETRDVSTKKKKEPEEIVKKIRKDKRPKCVKPMKKRDLSGVKPVAIIDLERSPFKELTPSPKDIIVLSDSDNDTNIQKNICDSSSQQVVSPEHCCGPKTPPEPQVKFTLTAKVPQLRNISNPLHEPDDIEPQTDNQQVDGLHKGPNTPPEPPNSPPSSPDAYDPFEPTKSRSPSPEPLQKNQTNNVLNIDNNRDNSLETRSNINEIIDKTNNSINPTPDVLQSHTPPLADVQPADSQSSIHETPESNIGKSPPECLNQNQSLQIQPTNFSITTTKSNVQTTFSTVPTSIITSTPINTNTSSSSSSNRINLLNTTILTTSNSTTTTTLQNRNILSNTIKSSPIKISPNKPSTITTNTTTSTTLSSSSSSSSSLNTRKPNNNRNQNNAGSSSNNNNNNNNESTNDNSINLDSPYSPGSSDYEGLFEPPVESPIKTKPPTNPISNNNNNNTNNNNNNNNGSNNNVGNKTVKSPARLQSAFDALFGSPMNKMIKPKTNEKSSNSNSNNKFNNNNKKSLPSLQSQPSLPPPLTTTSSSSIGSSKQVGIKFDEDSLKILDELPSSAVEMQVKDKFLKKLNRQERVVEEVKLVLKPHYNKKHINKEEYKDILRRAVPKICHNKSGEINPTKIKNLIEAYVKKIRHSKKVTSSSSVNPQKA